MLILQVTPEVAINAAHIESMVVQGAPEVRETVIVLKNRNTPVIGRGDWCAIWRRALKSGCIWTDGRTQELRS